MREKDFGVFFIFKCVKLGQIRELSLINQSLALEDGDNAMNLFTSFGIFPWCFLPLGLNLLFDFGFLVEFVEIVNNNGNGQGDA